MSEPQKDQYGQDASSQSEVSDENYDTDIVEEISLEDFQPKGTLALTLIYFVIISLMWIFMYFVEFAGKGPSIID